MCGPPPIPQHFYLAERCRSIFQNRLWLMTDYPPVKTWHFVWWSIMTAAGKVGNSIIVRITSSRLLFYGGWPHHCQPRNGTNLEELPWIACVFRFVKLQYIWTHLHFGYMYTLLLKGWGLGGKTKTDKSSNRNFAQAFSDSHLGAVFYVGEPIN